MSAPQIQYPPTSGGGAPVGGSGTTNTIPRWTGASTLGDSGLIDNGTAIYTTTRNVGIGTPSPVGRTDIAGTSVDQLAWGLLSVRSSDAQGADKGGSLAFGGLYDATNSTHWAQISGRKENGTSGQYGGYLAFATRTNGAGANTERARIDSTGNLLMAGNGTAANPIIANSTGVSGMYFPSATTVAIAANGAIAATFSKVAGAGVALGGTTGLVFDASGTQQGLKLPATPGNPDTQTLDAYKENTTWAPTVTWGTGGTVTTTSATGAYTQIGNVVTFTVTIAYNCSVIPTGGSITIDLPRTSATGFNQRPGLWAFNAWNGVAGSNFLSIGSASTTATLRVANATGTADIATYLTVTASGALVITATYLAS